MSAWSGEHELPCAHAADIGASVVGEAERAMQDWTRTSAVAAVPSVIAMPASAVTPPATAWGVAGAAMATGGAGIQRDDRIAKHIDGDVEGVGGEAPVDMDRDARHPRC